MFLKLFFLVQAFPVPENMSASRVEIFRLMARNTLLQILLHISLFVSAMEIAEPPNILHSLHMSSRLRVVSHL